MNLEPLLPSLDLLARSGDLMRERVVRWATINSGSHHPEGLAKMSAALESDFGKLPATLERVALANTAPALRLRCRPAAACQVLLSGHMDTVYGPDHPFQHCDEPSPGILHGPGVADMKGGLAVMLAALETFETFPGRDSLGWEVLITPDEEIGSPASRDLLEAAARRCHLGLVFEPALPDGALARARPGSANFTVTVHGTAAHVGRDFAAGRSAITALCEFITEIEHGLKCLPGAIFNAGRITGGGPLNVVPDHAEAGFNLRVTRTADMTAVEELVGEVARRIGQKRDLKVTIEGGFTRPPKEISPDLEALFGAWGRCAQVLGTKLDWHDTGGCCDGNNLAAAGLPNLDSLGVRGGRIHSAGEFLCTESLVERARLAALFLMALAAGEIRLPFLPGERP